jgi:hypothetical protein
MTTGLFGNISMPKVGAPGKKLFPARVTQVILNNVDDKDTFDEYNQWASIGAVKFSRLDNPTKKDSKGLNSIAYPIFSNSKIIPVLNEIIYIYELPGTKVQTNTNEEVYYYFQPINVWGSVHHNAIPDPVHGKQLPDSMQNDYNQTEAGAVRRVTDGGTEIDLGRTFKEKLEIKNIQPYEGDVLYEGRWGQSIRFGSTVKEGEPKNNWSDKGKNGDPITIIRNGQHDDGNDAWIPQIENINEDSSSIYVTSTQQIPIETINNEFTSYNTAPDKPNKYASSQVIINSNRLVFNAKKDSVLISGEKSVFLGGNGSLNFNAGKNVVIECNDIKLGDKEATEPIILGDKFLNDLNTLLVQISTLGTILGSSPIMIAPFTPSPNHIASATAMAERANNMLASIETYKSKVSKTQ